MNIASAFLDALIKIGYSEPEALLLAEKSAIKHRATSMKIRFVKLIALQSNQTSAACESLIHVRQSLEPRFTTDDKESLVPALNAAQLKLGCH